MLNLDDDELQLIRIALERYEFDSANPSECYAASKMGYIQQRIEQYLEDRENGDA